MAALKEHIAAGIRFHAISLKRNPDGLLQTLAEHEEVYEAIRNGDPATARKAMQSHLLASRNRLFERRRSGVAV